MHFISWFCTIGEEILSTLSECECVNVMAIFMEQLQPTMNEEF
jgi:hypothetical protein